MRLLRVGPAGSERPAVYDAAGRLRDLSSVTKDVDGAFLGSGGLARAQAALARGDLPVIEEPVRRGSPVARPGKLIAVGLNYKEHAAETGAKLPTEPVLFLKASDCVVGPDDPTLIPRGSTKMDYEVELAVVVGARAHYLPGPAAAPAAVAGYTIGNDVSERAFQRENAGGQWMKGKSCPTFAPLGPWLATSDEIPDPQALRVRSSVNGDVRQDESTAMMIFGVQHLVWYISQFMVLEPGDVILTGTPSGVALGRSDGLFLKAGDVVELEIDRLGRQRQVLQHA